MFDFFLEMFLEWDDIPSYEHLVPDVVDDTHGTIVPIGVSSVVDEEISSSGLGRFPGATALPLQSRVGLFLVRRGLSSFGDVTRTVDEVEELVDRIVHSPGFNLAPYLP